MLGFIILLLLYDILKTQGAYNIAPESLMPGACTEADIVCFGSSRNITSYGMPSEKDKRTSCFYENNCIIRVRAGRYNDPEIKFWWDISVPSAYKESYNEPLAASFWISKEKTRLDKPDGRIAILINMQNGKPTKVKQFRAFIVTPNGEAFLANEKTSFQFHDSFHNRVVSDVRDKINEVNRFVYNSSNLLYVQNPMGIKCYDIDLLKDKVHMHLTLSAPTIGFHEKVVSDSPILLFNEKTKYNDPSKPGGMPIFKAACEDDFFKNNEPTSTRRPIATPRITVRPAIAITPMQTTTKTTTTTTEKSVTERSTTAERGTQTTTENVLTTNKEDEPSERTKKPTKKNSSPMVFIILGGVLGLALVLIVLLCIICRSRLCSSKQRSFEVTKSGPVGGQSAIGGTSAVPSSTSTRSRIGDVSNIQPSDRDLRSNISSNIQLRNTRETGTQVPNKSQNKFTRTPGKRVMRT